MKPQSRHQRCLSPNTVFFKLKISPDLFDLEFDDCTRGPIHFSQRSLVWGTSNLVQSGFFILLHRLDVYYDLARREKVSWRGLYKVFKIQISSSPSEETWATPSTRHPDKERNNRALFVLFRFEFSPVSQERKSFDISHLFSVRLSRSYIAWKPFALIVETHRKQLHRALVSSHFPHPRP